MPKPEAVIFDLGRVLVGVDVSRGLWKRLLATLEKQNSATPAGRAWRETYSLFATGQMPPGEFHTRVCRLLGQEMPYPDFVGQWCDVFYDLQGAQETLRAVAAQLPTGLLSDTDPLHWRHEIDRNSWLSLIERPTLSFETGVLKPAREAYRAAARNVGVEPASCLFIDDLEENVAGAREVGMQALLFTGHPELGIGLARVGVLD
ncbi:MAG TPA: HAD-IA family hydrolase [Myxococcota bacterium]|nr:HAD-IA family hydrolase [Myxococcota bacterium]